MRLISPIRPCRRKKPDRVTWYDQYAAARPDESTSADASASRADWKVACSLSHHP